MKPFVELISAIRSINFSKRSEIDIPGDDEPCYWQRKEWCEWVLELAEAAEQALTRTKPGNEDAPPTGAMIFFKNDTVRHVKSGGMYEIVFDRGDNMKLEASDEIAYGYRSTEPGNHPIWLRAARKMEDGRFAHL